MENTSLKRKHNGKQQRFLSRFGPWAVVTGASDGIGKEISNRLAESGLNVVLVARRESLIRNLGEKLHSDYGIEFRALPLDLSRESDMEQLVTGTEDLEIGLLVAAAGFGTSGPLHESDLPSEIEMLHVNSRAVLSASYHFSRRFAQQKRGGIILLSSLFAFQGTPGAANYAATKAYVQTLAEGLYYELAPHGVSILASAPGPVLSGFADRANMKMAMALKPADVAQNTLDALGRQMTVRPGWLSKLLEYSMKTAPRWGRVRILKAVVNGMTKHKVI